MRNFPAAFTAQKNLRSGASPVWIFKVAAGGVSYYLSDNAFAVAPWGITTKKWVKAWGEIREGISGTLDEFRISDFSLDLLIDPDATPNMESLATGYSLEDSPVFLYLWYHGCADPPQEIFRGYIKDLSIPDETLVQISVQDESLRIERAMVGELVTLEKYPHADPDDVGAVIPIPFGPVPRLPAVAVNAGMQTSLPSVVAADAVTFRLSSGAGLSAGVVVQVDQEQILIGGINGDSVTECTRGYNATVAAEHQKGAVVWERKDSFDYLAAAVPVGSIPKVRVRLGQTEMDITDICTLYTGQVGDAHPSYPGKAVVTTPGYVTASQAVNLLIEDGLTLQQATDVVNALGLSGDLTVSTLVQALEALHDHTTTLSVTNMSLSITANSFIKIGSATFTDGFPADGLQNLSTGSDGSATIKPAVTGSVGIPKRCRWSYQYVAGSGGNTQAFTFNYNSGQWYDLAPQTWAAVAALALTVNMPRTGAGSAASIRRITFDVEVDTTASTVAAAVTGTLASSLDGDRSIFGTDPLANAISGNPTISGNSVANTLVGDRLVCDVVALNSSLSEVYSWLLNSVGFAGAFQKVGNWPACYSYSGAITEYRSALYWLNQLAFESRAWFRLSCGTAYLVYREASLVPVKTLPTCRISGGKKLHSRKKTVYDEILNSISLLYKRDWTQSKGPKAYAAAASDVDSDSIDTFGSRERADLFQFDFVTDPEMAADLLGFYLGWYAWRHWLHEFGSYLYDCELEFADVVTLGFSGDAVGQVMEARHAPGSSTSSDTIGLLVVV